MYRDGHFEETRRPPASTRFGEAPAWRELGPGWSPVFGNVRALGFSFEWHKFTLQRTFDWARSFHPGCLEICLNLSGEGEIREPKGGEVCKITSETAVFYVQGAVPLEARRLPGHEHRFMTLELSAAFLSRFFQAESVQLHPLIMNVLNGRTTDSVVSSVQRLPHSLQQLVDGLRHCPVYVAARETWFRSKALEIASHVFFQPSDSELNCTRTQRIARERVEKAKRILNDQLHDPPALDELAPMVGCSSFYLSRQFTQISGMTMQQYLRKARMDRAAELLSSGKCNVTEAALEVGYNSLSHFSAAFHEAFGCCPGLYPLRTQAQQVIPGEQQIFKARKAEAT
jgi:AraC-like DNA-binding protein